MMALQSARMGGLEVPASTVKRLDAFLDTVAHDGGRRYAYNRSEAPTPTMTAEGLLCRQYMGWQREDPRMADGAARLLARPIDYSDQNVYYWYYATQVLHNLDDERWDQWNRVMSRELPRHQVREGKERGSWHADLDHWGQHGGRLYTTCLSIYMLEVYYRHLPIYSQNFDLSLGE